MHCPRMDELPVITEWQIKIYCPNCKHYSSGECCNPDRKNNTDPCPIVNVEPLEIASEFKFKIYQKVLVKTIDAVICGEIVNRQVSTIGILYEIKAENNRFWITEDHLE